MRDYDFRKIEEKWRALWVANKTYHVEEDEAKKKFYVLNMFPYPSGAGMHVGHIKAYAGLEARQNALLDKTTEEIKAEIGERVFFLFENTPYGQQEYFIKLGMTASSEEDFNSIAQECLKADKTEHQIQVQNMINIETRNSINKSIEDLNRTARKIHEDNEFRARQQAEHNAQVARQNELSLKNQAKALDAQKKQREATEELEYRMRHK